MRVTDHSADVSIQREKYSGAIGSSVRETVIDDIVAFSHDAKLPQHYSDYAQEVWYEMLVKEGLAEKVRNIANTWSEDQENIRRAADHVRRPAALASRSLVRDSGYCRFRATSDQSSWSELKRTGIDDEQQVMVFVALDDLGPHNGFPFRLYSGQDVCIDGQTRLLTPPTGGGRAICFALRM